MICPRCKNEDINLFEEINGEYYCRKCISFKRIKVEEKIDRLSVDYMIKPIDYSVSFELSKRQKEISEQLKHHYIHHKNSYVWAVCGSGKTEIVFETIAYALSLGHRVCFAIPRKELAKELYERIQESFSNIEIGLFYGGMNKHPDAQMIICTTHQLYRFTTAGFDLMVLDEVDAFPYYGNDVLNAIFDECCKGNFIKLSATFTQKDIVNGELLLLNHRYHGHPLPVPKPIVLPRFISKYVILNILRHSDKRWFIYVPTIEIGKQFDAYLKRYIKEIACISSKTSHNKEAIDAIKQKRLKAIISTTILERGITVEDIQVMVYQADHSVFDERTLIQIAGRVGRKPNHYYGDVLFFTPTMTTSIKQCIQTIKYLNDIA